MDNQKILESADFHPFRLFTYHHSAYNILMLQIELNKYIL